MTDVRTERTSGFQTWTAVTFFEDGVEVGFICSDHLGCRIYGDYDEERIPQTIIQANYYVDAMEDDEAYRVWKKEIALS